LVLCFVFCFLFVFCPRSAAATCAAGPGGVAVSAVPCCREVRVGVSPGFELCGGAGSACRGPWGLGFPSRALTQRAVGTRLKRFAGSRGSLFGCRGLRPRSVQCAFLFTCLQLNAKSLVVSYSSLVQASSGDGLGRCSSCSL